MIKQLQNQQENMPKHDEATVSTAPTEATTQTPSTPTSLERPQCNNPKGMPPIPRSSSMVENSVANEDNPQDDVIIHQAIDSNNPIPENILSLPPSAAGDLSAGPPSAPGDSSASPPSAAGDLSAGPTTSTRRLLHEPTISTRQLVRGPTISSRRFANKPTIGTR